MASPFNVFRKNQRILMALLVGLSMIAFIAADSINATNFPIFLGGVLGALALWLLSGKGGAEGWLIAGVGGILGAVIGMYGPNLVRDNAVVYTNSGNLSGEQIESINRRQDIANRFLGLAYNTVLEKTGKEQRPAVPQPQPFGFVNQGVENAVLTYLFQEEADDLGIKLDDRDVTRFIQDVTGGQLTNSDLRRIRSELQVGTGDLVEILREQIRARDAFMLLVPKTGPTPIELWNDFKKLQSEAQATVATVPVEAFTSEVADPGDEQLEAFFRQYRDVPPAPDGTPGFLVPRQVQVAYLEIPFESLMKSVTPPTDAEVLAYYEKNRAQFEFDANRPGAPGTPAASGTPGASGTPTPGSTPLEAPRPAGSADANASETPDDSAAPATETPAVGTPSAETPGETTPAEPAPQENAPAESPAPEQSAIPRKDIEYVAFLQDAPTDDAPAADATPATDSATPDTASQPASDDAPAPAENAQQPVLPAPSATDEAGKPSQATLDQIRRTLVSQRARDAADTKLEQVRDDVDRIIEDMVESIPLPEDSHDPEQQAAFQAARRDAAKKVVEQMQAYARKNGLEFEMTPYMSYEDLSSSQDYAIGKAIRWEKNAPLFGRETTPIADAIFFQTTPEQPLTTIPAQSLLNDSRYIAVKAADVPPRPADLSEEGMRDKVVKAWKLREARQLAEDRAKELVAAAKKTGFEDAIQDATVTGKPKGEPLTTTTVGPFSWLRRSSAPRTDFAPPQILPTELPQLPAAGEEFMQTVFNELKVGGIGMAPAQDESAYYVVKVDSKSLESNLPKIREAFINEDFFSDPLDAFVGQPMNPFRRRSIAESRATMEEWLKNFRERHGVVERPAEES